MASLNVRKKNGTIVSLSGQAYSNDVEGTKKLCVRTGRFPEDVITYGLATTKTASEYSPIALEANGQRAYIGRKETHYTYSTNEQIDFNEIEYVNTQANPVLGGNLVSTKSAPRNYGTHMMTTFSNSHTDTVTLVNTETLPLTPVRTATVSAAYNTIVHMSTTLSNSRTASDISVNTAPNATLDTTLTRTVSEPYNLVINRSTTFANTGEAKVGYAANIPENFPNPDSSTSKENINGVYKTVSSINKSQYVKTYKSTVYHTYDENTNYVQSTNGSGEYYCEATVGQYAYQGVYGTHSTTGAQYNNGLSGRYSWRYSWTISSYRNGNYYYWSEGIHLPNQGADYGQSNNRPTSSVSYRISGLSSVGAEGNGTANSGTTRYSYKSSSRTSYSMYWNSTDYAGIWVNISTTYSTWYSRSSAPMTTTKNTVKVSNKTELSNVDGSKEWYTAPGSYNNDTKNENWHGKENVLKTITETKLSYGTTTQAFTAANMKEENTYDTVAINNTSSYALQINSTLSRTTYYSKKLSSTYTTHATNSTASVLDDVRESALSTHSVQVNATSSYTINFGKKISYTNTTNADYKEIPFVDTESVSGLSTYSKQVNSTSSYSVNFSKNVSHTYSTKSKTYSTINNSTIEVPDRLIEKVTHNFI